MKNAELWKRILHGGILFDEPGGEWLPDRIIKSPIIFNAQSLDKPNDDFLFEWEIFRGLSIPFTSSFWIEQPTYVGNVGTLVSPIRRPDKSWFVRMICVCYAGNNPAVACVTAVGITADGDLKGIEQGGIAYHESKYYYGWEEEKNEVMKRGIRDTYVYEALNVLLKLSCKNVSLAARDNDPKQVRIASKRHGPSSTGYRYHVLVVKPPGAKSDHPGEEIGSVPRHLVRGHYAEYGPEFKHSDGTPKGKLFGELCGRFYIKPTLRGNEKNGIVEKDYEIRATA